MPKPVALFERVHHLQDAKVCVVASNDLHATNVEPMPNRTINKIRSENVFLLSIMFPFSMISFLRFRIDSSNNGGSPRRSASITIGKDEGVSDVRCTAQAEPQDLHLLQIHFFRTGSV